MPELKLVPPPVVQRHTQEQFPLGCRLGLAQDLPLEQARRLCADEDMVIGGYRISSARADILPADPQRPDRLFIWNSDTNHESLRALLRPACGNAERSAAPSSVLLTATGLGGPELQLYDNQQRLSLSASFELEWQCHSDTARLAAVELVQSTRSIRFEDGSELSLLDTGEIDGAVRYAQGDDAPLKLVTQQPNGIADRYLYEINIGQQIPEQLHGKAVGDVTVLEKYTSYFLQCEDPRDLENHIWVPVLTPVIWGWSIRVGRRTDGEWGIIRRKLLMPTTLDSGLELPVWQTDSRRIANAADLMM